MRPAFKESSRQNREKLRLTNIDCGGNRSDEDQLLHLGLGGVPLVVEAGDPGVGVVAVVVVVSKGVRTFFLCVNRS